MSLQPGVGYSFRSSGSGTTLDIIPSLYSTTIGDSSAATSNILDDSDFINQFLIRIVDTGTSMPFTQVMKIAAGGHIYLRTGEACDKTAFTNTIYHDTAITVVNGSTANSHWCNDDGHVEISEGSYYVYAYRVDALEESFFYIYVSTTDNLDAACPATLPEGITAPTGEYTVQCLKIGSAVYSDGWTVYQKLVGSITWPSSSGSSPTASPEQFQTRVLPDAEEGVWQVQVARGRVITGGGRQAVGEYDVQGFAIYPTDSKVNGGDSGSPYVDQGGYVKISNADYDGSNTWGVYIVSNPSEGNYPMLAVIADGSDADTKSQPWTTRVSWIDVCPYTVSVITTPTPPYEVYLKSYDSVSNQHQENYNCQRIKIATLYWDSVHSNWIVRQWLIGSLTNPSIEWWNGNREYNSEDGIPSWATTTDYQTEQDAWLGTWTGYYKWNGSGAHPSTNILP